MSTAEVIDRNFIIKTKLEKSDLVFYDSLDEPFEINGIFYEDGKFRRMPEEIAKTVSVKVHTLHTNTAGGRIRFRTDSPYVAIKTSMDNCAPTVSFFSISGVAGFDMYVKKEGKETYYRTFVPPMDMKDGYESVIDFEDAREREITINFPLYSNVSRLLIGVSSISSKTASFASLTFQVL